MPPTHHAPRPDRPRTPLGLWRALPFTAQLLVIGMLVGLSWFLASRADAERQQDAALARNADLVRLQRAEVLASRLGRTLTEMSRDERAYLLLGDARFIAHFEMDSIDFELDAARLLETNASAVVEAHLQQVRDRLALWRDSAVAPRPRPSRARWRRGLRCARRGPRRTLAQHRAHRPPARRAA